MKKEIPPPAPEVDPEPDSVLEGPVTQEGFVALTTEIEVMPEEVQ